MKLRLKLKWWNLQAGIEAGGGGVGAGSGIWRGSGVGYLLSVFGT